MNLKLFVAFTVLGLSVVGAKSYDVTIFEASKAGTADLKPGKYSVIVDGSKIRFTDTSSRKTTEVNANIVSVDKKFQTTQIDTVKAEGQTVINEIDLGGTTTKLEFNKTSGGPVAQ